MAVPRELISLTASSERWSLRPGQGLHERARLQAPWHRTRTGGRYVYPWAEHYAATVPLHRVEAALAGVLRQWWAGGHRIALTWAEGGGYRTRVVRLASPERPLGAREPPGGTERAGLLRLEATGPGAPVAGAPLLLDHLRFGTLDTFNVLL